MSEIFTALHTGALFIAMTMFLFWFWSVIATKNGTKSKLLVDLQPLCLWVETRSVRAAIHQNRAKTLFFVFSSFGFILWAFLALSIIVLNSLSPELFSLLNQS